MTTTIPEDQLRLRERPLRQFYGLATCGKSLSGLKHPEIICEVCGVPIDSFDVREFHLQAQLACHCHGCTEYIQATYADLFKRQPNELYPPIAFRWPAQPDPIWFSAGAFKDEPR